MQIEAGKFYKDQAGRKRGPMVGSRSKWEAGAGGMYDDEWDNDGKAQIGDSDLVSEWVESVALRIPKAGDRVRILTSAKGTAAKYIGETVAVDRVYGNPSWLILEFASDETSCGMAPLVTGEWEFADALSTRNPFAPGSTAFGLWSANAERRARIAEIEADKAVTISDIEVAIRLADSEIAALERAGLAVQS